MHVIVVNDYGSITGGAAQVAISSLNALADAGVDVTFVSGVLPIDTTIDQQKVRTINFGLNDLLGNPNKLQALMTGIWNRHSAKLFGELLDEHSSETTVIHIHGWLKSFSSSIVREALKRQYKIVITLHDYFTVCPNGGFYNFQAQAHCYFEPMSLSCFLSNCDSRSYAHKAWRLTRQFVQNNNSGMPLKIKYFISVSGYSENILRRYLPSTARIFRIINPIDIARMPIAQPSEFDAFTFVGRLSPEKGGALFAAAAKKANVRSVFVGTGTDASLITRNNPKAELKGWCSRLDVVRNIRASRAVVFPSLLHETQGMAVAEAAALGVPAIVSDGCAAREAIQDGVTGFLFKCGDVNDLSKKLAFLNANPDASSRMGRTAYDRYWAAPCDLDTHVNQLITCYRKILS